MVKNLISTTQFDQSDPQGANDVFNNLWCEDGNEDSNDSLDHASILNKEWKLRQEQFYTIGYRDGITAGKEASAQEGFNAGFEQSVQAGCNWGLVKGITRVLTSIPEDLKEKLVGSSENRDKVQKFYESVQAISPKEALKMCHGSAMLCGSMESPDHSNGAFSDTAPSSLNATCNMLEHHYKELLSLLHELPEIGRNVNMPGIH